MCIYHEKWAILNLSYLFNLEVSTICLLGIENQKIGHLASFSSPFQTMSVGSLPEGIPEINQNDLGNVPSSLSDFVLEYRGSNQDEWRKKKMYISTDAENTKRTAKTQHSGRI